MKAIMISIRPEWVAKILNGEKVLEVRRGSALYKAINTLIDKQGVAPMLVDCTKGKDKKDSLVYVKHDLFDDSVEEFVFNGRVVARFNATAEEIKQRIGVFWVWGGHPYYTENVSEENLLKRSCLSATKLEKYLQGKIGTAIHINDLKVFDRPKLLTEFNRVKWDKCGVKDKNGLYQCHKCPYAIHYGHGFGDCGYDKPLKAPQSWCYVEV